MKFTTLENACEQLRGIHRNFPYPMDETMVRYQNEFFGPLADAIEEQKKCNDQVIADISAFDNDENSDWMNMSTSDLQRWMKLLRG